MKPADALLMVARTDVGLHRHRNEDAIHIDPVAGLAILADGMGGYKAGEVASSMAVQHLADHLGRTRTAEGAAGHSLTNAAEIENTLAIAVGGANRAVFEAARRTPQHAGMGTTLVLAYFYDHHMSVAHVGDSRLYRANGGVFEQLTRDHSFLQEQLDSGIITPEQARCSVHRNLVTRALGVEPTVAVEIHDYAVLPGDIVLLCSDGLNDMVDDTEIAATLHTLGDDLAQAAERLIQLANEAGGRDNVSVILVKVVGNAAGSAANRQAMPNRLQ